MKGKTDTPRAPYPGKWKITTDDESTGSVMDTQRPKSAVYNDSRQIGPQSKTNFGKNRQAV